MPITFTCPVCGTDTAVDDSLAGEQVRCRECNTLGRAPSAHASKKEQPIASPRSSSPSRPSDGPQPLPARASLKIPIWGTFLLLLVAFLAGLAWGGWALFDKFYRQPRFAEMRSLHAEWSQAMKRAAYAHSLMNKAVRDVQRDIATADQFRQMADLGDLDTPESREIRRQADAAHKEWAESFLRDAKSEDDYWARVFNENSQAAAKLDQRSRERFGVPAAELPSQIPN